MREIKFRAWDKVRKEYLSAGQILISIEPGRRPERSNFYLDILKDANKYNDRFIIEQYTGLKDKNGKEIYEGDIVKYTFDLPESTYATEIGLKIRTDKIFWSDWRSSFSVGNQLANNDLFRYVRNGNRVEVIGNIYENPELLEAQDV